LDGRKKGPFNMTQSIRSFLGFLAAVTVLNFEARGAENVTGIWKWTFTRQNGDPIDSLLILTQDAEKLSGTLSNRFGKSEITDGKINESQVNFNVKREVNGAEFVIKYTGKLQGEKIIGKSLFERDGEMREREWEAKREAAKSAAAAGTWNTTLILPDGNRIEGTLKLKQEGEKLTGVAARNESETAIQDGKVFGDEVSFKVLREREGRTVTAKYKGKISGDKVKGKVESDWSGDWQTLDWEGTRAGK
jgi:hypothetical protein